jgi:hypothetical protein
MKAFRSLAARQIAALLLALAMLVVLALVMQFRTV